MKLIHKLFGEGYWLYCSWPVPSNDNEVEHQGRLNDLWNFALVANSSVYPVLPTESTKRASCQLSQTNIKIWSSVLFISKRHKMETMVHLSQNKGLKIASASQRVFCRLLSFWTATFKKYDGAVFACYLWIERLFKLPFFMVFATPAFWLCLILLP